MKIDLQFFVLMVVLVMTSCISLSSSMSLTNLIMRGVESKRCEDALCLDCVPGFCRERPVRPQPALGGFPNLTISNLPPPPNITGTGPGGGNGGGAGNGNLNINGNGNQNSGQVSSNQPSSLNELANSFGVNNGVANGQSQTDANRQPNVQNEVHSIGTSIGQSANSGAIPSLLSPDSGITNSTGGPPVLSTTLPPQMCMCSWI